MLVRTVSAEIGPERLEDFVRRYRETVRPVNERCAGLRDHYVLVDRQSGRAMVIGVWDSLEALEAAAPTLEPARERLWDDFPETPDLQAYEVADAFHSVAPIEKS
jgi:hypothetical protein